jgi:Sec-independent protein secretion pathway component TatC
MTKYLIEIKNRITLIFSSVLSVLIVAYYYKEIILFLIIKPSLNANLNFGLYYFIFTDVTEIFSVYIKVILFLVVQSFIFFLLYHIISFLNFAFFEKEYIFFNKLLRTCFIAGVCSISVSSYILIPFSWNFFFNFQNIVSYKFISLYFEPKIIEYLNFCISIYSISLFYFLIFAILFFIVSYFSNNINMFKKFRKLYYYSFVIFSTLITPPDIFSQLFFSFTLVFFFELFTIIFIFKKILIGKIIKTN